MPGSRSGGTGCFGYWSSTACWCSPGGVSQDHPQFSPLLSPPQLAQTRPGANHRGGARAGLGRRHHLSASPERAAVPEPGDGCLLTQDSGPSRARRDARRVGGDGVQTGAEVAAGNLSMTQTAACCIARVCIRRYMNGTGYGAR